MWSYYCSSTLQICRIILIFLFPYSPLKISSKNSHMTGLYCSFCMICMINTSFVLDLFRLNYSISQAEHFSFQTAIVRLGLEAIFHSTEGLSRLFLTLILNVSLPAFLPLYQFSLGYNNERPFSQLSLSLIQLFVLL